MFGLSSRSGQRKEPTWTQAPSSNAQVDPVWRDAAPAASRYEPSQQQAAQAAPRSRSSSRLWISAVVGIVGLAVAAFLFLSMVNVVEEQVARNQPQSSTAPSDTGMTLVSSPASR